MDKILQQVHPFAITPPKEEKGRWMTYVKEKGKKYRTKVTSTTEEGLLEALLEFYDPIINRSTKTLNDTFDEYIEYKKNFVKVENKKKAISITTITRAIRDYNNYFRDTELGKTLISNLKKKDIEIALIQIIKARKPSEKCAKNLLGYVSQTFKYAFDNEIIESNSFERIDKDLILAQTPTTYKKSDEERVLTKKEIEEFVTSIRAHLENHPSYAPDYALLLALHTGMRVGELAALKWEDIHDDFIHIDRMERRLDFENKKYQLVIDEPKGLRHRSFPLSHEIEAILGEIRANCEASEYIFTLNGKRCTERAIEGACSRRSKEAGFLTSIHEIRRTVSSELNKVLPRSAVANLLGHDEDTNKAHYSYDTTQQEEKVKGISSMYSNVLNFNEHKKNAKAL